MLFGRMYAARVLVALVGTAVAAPTVAAQSTSALALAPGAVSSRTEGTALARGRYAVVIDLDRNRLYFKSGEVTLWSAPVGTGTGLRMKSDEGDWKFNTPNGVFQVQYKEENPVWVASDWYFIENGLPVPPQGDPKRNFPGGLGSAAVFIGHDLAIHGTNKPDLLGQRVSHGCIRLSNRDALRLFHNVQVGTEVVIVGGEDVPEVVVTPAMLQAQRARAALDPNSSRTAPKDPVLEAWRARATADLLRVLDVELDKTAATSRWSEIAALLVERGLKKSDDLALIGLIDRASGTADARIAREYGTFLAHAYGRGPMRTLDALSSADRQSRQVAARAIVEATMNLYHGDFEAPGAPWPSARIPRSAIEASAWRGWDMLASAETEFRERS